MNVFVLCTGRCGSTTFAKACAHITNYTAAHESRYFMPGPERLSYPANHIEVDNRLSWFLGRLDQEYGRSAFYVHLTRNADEVAESFAARRQSAIMQGYITAICPMRDTALSPKEIAADLVRTVTANIELFLRDKPLKMPVQLEHIHEMFPEFWTTIGAAGNLPNAMRELSVRHNAGP